MQKCEISVCKSVHLDHFLNFLKYLLNPLTDDIPYLFSPLLPLALRPSPSPISEHLKKVNNSSGVTPVVFQTCQTD